MIKNILAISLLLKVFGNPALAQQNGKQFLLSGKIKIVDPDGKIVGRFVGEDDAIYKKLDEILK